MTQSVDLELDHLARELTQHLERALIAARRAAQSRAAQHQAARRTTATVAAEQSQGIARALDRPTRELATAYPVEALAARWAAADALRAEQPLTAAAWDSRVTDDGVDLATVQQESGVGADSTSQPRAAASDLVTEHLAEVYTDDAVASVAAGPVPVHAPSAAELIAATHPGHPVADPEPVFDPPAPTLGAEVVRGRDAGHDLGLDR